MTASYGHRRHERRDLVLSWRAGASAPTYRRSLKISLPAAARESFLKGTWDATGMLLDRYEDVEAVANRLPYVTGWR